MHLLRKILFPVILIFLFGKAYAQNIGISTDGTPAETGVMLDVKSPTDKATTATSTLFQVKSFNSSTNELKMRLILHTDAAGVTSRYGQLDVADYTGGTPTYVNLALQPVGGKVGIGTTSPLYSLDINPSAAGAMRVGTQGQSSKVWVLGGCDGTNTSTIYMYDPLGSIGVQLSDGRYYSSCVNCQNVNGINFGIGISSPLDPLHVDLSAGVGNEVRIDKDVDWIGLGFTQLRINGKTNPLHMLRIGYSTTGDFAVLQSQVAGSGIFNPIALNPNGGLVGIGTTTPSTSLEIKGTGTTLFRLQPALATDDNVFIFGAASATLNRAKIYSTGSLGDVNGDLRFSTGFAGTPVDPAMVIKSTGAVSFNGVNNYGTTGQVLTSNGNVPPTWTNGPSVTGSGNMVLLYPTSSDVSSASFGNAANITSIESYTMLSNYTLVKAEVEVDFDGNTGGGNPTIEILYNGVVKRTLTLHTLTAAPLGGSCSYVGTISSGQVVSIDAHASAGQKNFFIRNFRVYGIY